MAITVFMYACWRFWEGITGQGSDDAFGKFKNFFKYRLSPLVSVSTTMLLCKLSALLALFHFELQPFAWVCNSSL